MLTNVLFIQARQGFIHSSLQARRAEERGAGAGAEATIAGINNTINNSSSNSSSSRAGVAAVVVAARVPLVTLACLPLVDYKVVSSKLGYSRNDLVLR